MKRTAFLFFVLLSGLVGAGCGYSTRAHVTPLEYKTIYVAPFDNKIDVTSETNEGSRFKTTFPMMENTVKNAVVDRFILDGELKVVKEEAADIILKGSVVNYRRDSLREASDDTPEEYRVTIFMDLALTNPKTGKLIWEKKSFAGEANYYTTGQYTKTESQAVQDASRDLARRIIELIVETW
jgi:hypothetical protein